MAGFQLQVTGFGYEHDEAWSANMELFRQFTDETTGVRRLGAAAVDLCHVALGANLPRVPCIERPRTPSQSPTACAAMNYRD